ncbi:MAG: alpha-1,6-mannanase [Bacteroidaceae bacterium]|nr:alpha-1,6-mannanase [Bacteroidaceae bacterium]
MTNHIAYFLFLICYFIFPVACTAEESEAMTDLRRAIALTDATMEKSFTGNDLRMYDTYDVSTQKGSGTADVWPYTAALEAHCSVLEALELLSSGGFPAGTVLSSGGSPAGTVLSSGGSPAGTMSASGGSPAGTALVSGGFPAGTALVSGGFPAGTSPDDIETLYAETHDRYVKRLKSLFNNLAFYAGTYTLTSYASARRWTIYGVHRAGEKGRATVTGIENVYDDQMWLCREMVRAYRLTGDKAYLTEATMLADYCIDGWDCCLDADGNEYGGISWGPGYNSKHSCSNGPLIQPLVWLADIYRSDDEAEDLKYYYILPDGTRTSRMRRHSEVYLEMARKIYLWQKEKLLNRGTGVYWDMLGAPGEIQYVTVNRRQYRTHVDTGGPSGTAYTYNTGTMLGGAAELYRVTGEAQFLDDLNELCRSSVNQFAKRRRLNGTVYREWPTDDVATSGFNTWFDDVLMRAFVDAHPYNTTMTAQVTFAATALASFQQNLDYAWENHLRDQFLPIHLLDGWGDATVTKGFHQLAFASELAMLAVWQQRCQTVDGIPRLRTDATRPNATKCCDLLGRYLKSHIGCAGLYVAQGRKILVR